MCALRVVRARVVNLNRRLQRDFRVARSALGQFRAAKVCKKRSSCRLLHDTVPRRVVWNLVPFEFQVGGTRQAAVGHGQGPQAVALAAQGRHQGIHPDTSDERGQYEAFVLEGLLVIVCESLPQEHAVLDGALFVQSGRQKHVLHRCIRQSVRIEA